MKVKEALFDSFKMLKEKPKFILPMIVLTILSTSMTGLYIAAGILITGGAPSEDVVAPPGWYWPSILTLMIIVVVVGIPLGGMYPSMVRAHIEKKELNFKDSFRFSFHKFWSLLGAILLGGLIISVIASVVLFVVTFPLGLLNVPTTAIIEVIVKVLGALLIPIFFYYIPSVIIMDDLKAVAGFKKSLEAGKKNYLFTFLIYLVPALIGFAIYRLLIWLPAYLELGISYALALLIPYAIITLFISTWGIIIPSYAYYGLRANR